LRTSARFNAAGLRLKSQPCSAATEQKSVVGARRIAQSYSNLALRNAALAFWRRLETINRSNPSHDQAMPAASQVRNIEGRNRAGAASLHSPA
jgi:hypothetical protein